MSLPALLALALVGAPARTPDTPSRCESCAEWNQPHAPLHVFGNTYWVGTAGLSSVAIDTGAGVILLDGALPQSAPLIEQSLKAVGLRIQDVKLIGNTHTHFDHAGGLAALQRDSGATVMASPRAREELTSGCAPADDPQAAFGCADTGIAPVRGPVRELHDGEVVRLGKVELTAHFSPGHTPGGTTWTWRSCEGARCLSMVYADSLNAVSAPGYRFTPVRAALEASIERVAALPCDVLLSAHPDASDTVERLSTPTDGGRPDPAQPGACREYAARAKARLEKRLAEEAAPDAGAAR
jgi:metallo-beta-lactamase class B